MTIETKVMREALALRNTLWDEYCCVAQASRPGAEHPACLGLYEAFEQVTLLVKRLVTIEVR